MAAPHGSTATRVRVAAGALVCLMAIRLLLGDGTPGLALDAALALTAVVATLDAARRARAGRSRLAWRCQTAAAAAWLLAPLAWAAHLPDGVATTGRVAFVVLTGTAWLLTSLSADPWSRVRLLIDSWLVGASVFVVAWSGLFETIARSDPPLGGTLAVALPLAALAVAVVACGVALTEMQPAQCVMPALFAVALLSIGASDIAYGLGGRPFWALGWALFTLGTRTYGGTSERREVISTRRWLVHAPYLVLTPAAITLAVHEVRGGAPTAELTAAVVMAVLLLIRQQVTLAENAGLVERLAATQLLLRHQATHDALTGLPGRVLLHERLGAAIDGRLSRPGGLAVLFADLDDFKVVNDTLGHAAGDDVLAQTAQRLTAVLAPLGDDAAAFRMSGDEFAILLTGAAADDAAGTAARLLDAILAPMTVNAHPVSLGGSLGVAVASADEADDVDPSAMLRAADLAMYDVKHHGKSGVALAPVVRGGPAQG